METPMQQDHSAQEMKQYFIDTIIINAKNWTARLRLAGSLGREEWLRVIQWVDEDCTFQRKFIAWLVPASTETLNCAPREFLKVIEDYDINNTSDLSTSADRITHKYICRSMLNSVLLPGITAWDTSFATSELMKELMILSFPSLPNLKCLRVAPDTTPECSWLLANNIQMLRHLQEFYFPFGCSREILAELSKHCSRLKRLSIMSSKHVDDGSLIHLRKLKDLVFLDIDGTAITAKGYSTILTHLKIVENITWSRCADDVVASITKDCVLGVKSLIGTVRNMLPVVLKCPFLSRMTLYGPKVNLLDLKNLTLLAALTLADCDCDTLKFGTTLQYIGIRLRDLHLTTVNNVNIGNVIEYCTHLETLVVENCDFTLPKDLYLFFFPTLRHFQNLSMLELTANLWYGDFHSYLKSCVRLKVFTARKIPELDDTVVETVVMSKGFRELREFSAYDCGLSTKSAVLLIENCKELIRLKGLGTWSISTKADIAHVLLKAKNATVPVTVDL
jgi:Leucine-rich repeat (LRR) protein